MRTLAIALLLSGAMMWAQATTPQTPPAGGQAQTGTGTAQSTRPMHHRGMGPGMGQGMGAQQMQQNMKAMTDQMRTKLDTMRTAMNKVTDPNVKQALQADYDMWQTMYNHMQQMQTSMQQHAQQHQQGMSGGSANPPASGQAPPPQR